MLIEVLIIEDDEDIREYTKQIMSEWSGLGGNTSFKFTEALDGLEGLNKLHENYYDIAIVDMKMPKLGGHQLIPALRTNDGMNQHIPVIVLSGFPEAYFDEMKSSEWIKIFTVDKPLEAKKFHRAITFALAARQNAG